MKLLKKDRKRLQHVLDSLKAGHDYLLSDHVLLCSRSSFASTTLHFTNPKGEICVEFNKEIGSKFVQIQTGISALERILSEEI